MLNLALFYPVFPTGIQLAGPSGRSNICEKLQAKLAHSGHLSIWAFFPMSLVPFCLSPVIGTVFFGSGYQPKTTWGPLFCFIPVHSSPHSRSLGGRKVLRRPHEEQGCRWGRAWDPAKRHVLPLQHREVIFQADQGSSGAQRNLDYKFIQHRHITSVVWNKSNMSSALLSKVQCLVGSWRPEV